LATLTLLHPLWLLAALALFAATVWWRRPQHGDDWHRVLSRPVLSFLGGAAVIAKRLSVPLLAGSLCAALLSSPAVRRDDANTLSHSIGWIAVADVARSMTIDDTVPSRLSAMRDGLMLLSESAGARPLALIIYAGDAFLAVPPAFDKTLFNEHAALLDYEVMPVDGSNLARALSLATSVAEESAILHARVVVFTDSGGAGRASEAAARHLASLGHRVDVVLYGTSGVSTEGSARNSADERRVDTRSADTTSQAVTESADAAADQSAESAAAPADQSADTGQVNQAAAAALARAGNGEMIAVGALGVLEAEHLITDEFAETVETPALRARYWHNQSHWLMLILIPLVLLLFQPRYRQ